MKNLFLVRLIVVFLLASLVHIDMVNAQEFISHHTPRKINKADRKELDKKLAEFDTLQLRRESLLLNLRPPLYNYSYLYLDKNDRIRKYEYLLHLHDGEAALDSVSCYYDSDGKLLKCAYEDGCDAYFQYGLYYVKNGRIVDYETYYRASFDEEEENDDDIIGDSLGFYQYHDTDTLIKYLKDMGPYMYDHPSDYSYFERPNEFSFKAIDSYDYNWVHFSTPFNDCDYKLSDWTEIGKSTTPTYGKLNEINQMPLKKYLLHYEYFTYGDVIFPQEKINISYLYLDSLNRLRKCETIFKDDKKDDATSCFFDEDGSLLYVSYYNGSERGYFYVKDSLLHGKCVSDKDEPYNSWNRASHENGVYSSWTFDNPFKFEDALKNHEILMFPLFSCLHVTMLPIWIEYERIMDGIITDVGIDVENSKATLPPYALPVPLQQPY